MGQIKKEYTCSLMLTHDLIGGKWKLRVLWYIIKNTNRFSQLEKSLPEISQKVLSSQLRELEKSGLILRTVYPDIPPRVEYTLTEQGEKLKPIILDLCAWSDGYATENEIIVP